MNGSIKPNNRNSQRWGHSLLAWQVVVQSQPTETFSSTLFIKDFLRKGFLILDLLDVWILFWVSFFLYFFFFLCPFSFPSNIPHTFFPLLSPRLPLHLCSLIPLFISIIFPASCLSHCGCQFSLLISKTLHLCVVCDLARPPSEGCHMRDSCWHDTQVTPSDEQMSASEAMHLFFVSHAHTHPRSDTHRRTRVSVLYGSKNAYTLFTQSSTSNVLTVPFPLLSLSPPPSLSHTHTHPHTHTHTQTHILHPSHHVRGVRNMQCVSTVSTSTYQTENLSTLSLQPPNQIGAIFMDRTKLLCVPLTCQLLHTQKHFLYMHHSCNNDKS